MRPDYLVVGHVTKPHGMRGELFVWPLTDSVDDIYAPGRAVLIGDEHGQLDADAGSLVVESAPAALKSQMEVWGLEDSARVLMGRMKAQLDPEDVFSPGRFGVGVR